MTRVLVAETREGARFSVRVTPRASHSAIVGMHGEGAGAAVKIALHAPPLEGRANEALIDFLSDLLGVSRSAVAITAGQHARVKMIVVRGRSAAEIASSFDQALSLQAAERQSAS